MLNSSAAGSPLAVDASGVAKSFGSVTALSGIDLAVPAGTLAALLGPNGAGKTTLVRIVATLTRPDRGRVRVLGFDVAAQPGEVRRRIGLTGQFAGLDDALSGTENLVLIGRLAGLRRREARARASQVAELVAMASAAGRSVRTYSGGMRRRLDLAASLMTSPPLLVLDEPTTGLDPASRQQLWQALAGLRAAGTTMLLTTQYLEEADRFADQVHVLDRGAIIASGTPAQLKSLVGGQVVEIALADPGAGQSAAGYPAANCLAAGYPAPDGLALDAEAVARALAGRLDLPPGSVRAESSARRLTVLTRTGTDGDAGVLLDVAAALRADGVPVADLALRQPSLDEAFLALTGRPEVAA
ncbi:MAG TPA: ATP-binding cassette domain-containing protein [Streptosporangiaceae bacterium]|nr:ATP-binding cassette domain-containing protein [Streptosporangiaceae bacterium]